jgi:hypothetical protein
VSRQFKDTIERLAILVFRPVGGGEVGGGEGEGRRKVRLIEGNAKCRHLNLLSEAQNPTPPSVYVYTVYLFTQGRGGKLNQREG